MLTPHGRCWKWNQFGNITAHDLERELLHSECILLKSENKFVSMNCQLCLFLDWDNIKEKLSILMVFLGHLHVVLEQ